MSEIKATATTADVANIVTNSTEYGFEWYDAPISVGKGETKKVLTDKAPRIKVTDLDTFVTAFGSAFVLSGLNGTSVDVKVESVIRGIYEKNVTAKTDEVRAAVVKRVLLGERSYTAPAPKIVEVVKEVFRSLDGQPYATEIEKKQADLAFMIDQGTPLDLARKLLGIE